MALEQLPANLSWIRFLTRWMLGILFGMAGYWKIFILSVQTHAQDFFINGFADHWIPEFILWPLGYVIPFWELAAGLLLIIGFKTRWVLLSLGVLLLITTYGHALQTPLFDIDGHTFTRFILLLICLVIPATQDRLSLDARH